MSKPSLRRLLSLALALPVVASVAPLAGVAQAAAVVNATALPVPGGKVGPNAGYRDPAQGIQGTTPLLRLQPPAPTDALRSVTVGVSGPTLSIFRDFAIPDGFAVYRDLTGDGFTADDHTAGPVSGGFRIGAASGGRIPVTIDVDESRATGANAYFVTVRPAPGINVPDRPFVLSLAEDGVRIAGAESTTSTAVTLPSIAIDSRPPATPATGNFTRVRQPAGTEDAYTVVNERTEADKFIAFYNSITDVALSNLLVRAPAAGGGPAIHPAPFAPTDLRIGDGTGITNTVKVARNNQTSDNVFARALDSVGNLSAAIGLTGANDWANDVTAPTYTTFSVALKSGTTGANASNEAAVPVTTSSNVDTSVVSHQARLVQLDAAGQLSDVAGPWGATASTATGTDVNTDSRPLSNGRFRVQARFLDSLANVSDVVTSAASYPKDLTVPSILSVVPVEDVDKDGAADPGDRFRLFFSEAMPASVITDTNGNRQPCATGACLNSRILVTDSTTTGPTAARINWGVDPAVAWASDGASVTITAGTAQPGFRLPAIGDTVSAATSVRDEAGNIVANQVLLTPAGLLPSLAETQDIAGLNLFTQNRDGVLDAVDVTFGSAVAASSLPAVLPNTHLLFPFGTVAAESAEMVDATKVRFRFSGGGLSGERPIVLFTEPAAGAGTGLTSTSGEKLTPSSLGAVDRAKPTLIRVTTADTTKDGRLDRLVLKYSEPINHLRESPSGYVVPGYETTGGGTMAAQNAKSPSDGFSDETVVTLQPKSGYDTDALPGFRFTGTATRTQAGGLIAAGTDLCDVHNNCQVNLSSVSTDPFVDGAPPVLVERRTADLDNDGRVDGVLARFSEALRTDSVHNAQFTVVDRSVLAVGPVPDALPDVVQVEVNEIAPVGSGDTDSVLKIQYTGGLDGGVRDAGAGSPTGNPAVTEAAPVNTVDGAGPAIVAATSGQSGAPGDGTKVKVAFSEPTAAKASAEPPIFMVFQGTDASGFRPSTEVAYAADGKTADVTLETPIDPAKDAYVAFAADGVVEDKATPQANANTQISQVLAPPFPVAILAPQGPPGSAPGHSTSATFTTGAASSSGVVGWKFMVQTPADDTVPPDPSSTDEDFTASAPATYTAEAGDGVYSLHLWVKDAFGQVSQRATADIVVDRTGPVATVPFLDKLGVGRTGSIRDGDTVRVIAGMTPLGGGAVSFTADYRNLTGRPQDGAVTPFSKSGSTHYFPYVKAAGTTVYPVGTTLQVVGDRGQPFILEDGPGGTVVKRRFLSTLARATYRIPNALVIHVPAAVLATIPEGPVKTYRDGQLVRAAGTSPVYVVQGSVRRPVPSRFVFESLGYRMDAVLSVPAAELGRLTVGAPVTVGVHPVGTYVRDSATGATYVVVKGADGALRKRRIVSTQALLSWVGFEQVANLPSDAASLQLADDASSRGMRDGMLIRHANDPRVFVVSRGARRHIDSRGVFEAMGFSFRNVVLAADSSVGVPTIGLPVGSRRVFYSVTAKDTAGNTDTKVSSVVGLGIPELLPVTAPHAPRP